MENRPAALRSRRVCRFCLTDGEPLNFIYDRELSKSFRVPLSLQIMSCIGIEVYSADGMPQMICTMCHNNLDRCYKFKQQCKKADEALRAYPLTGVLPRPFPPISLSGSELSEASPIKRQAEVRASNESAKKSRLDNGERDRRENPYAIERREIVHEEKPFVSQYPHLCKVCPRSFQHPHHLARHMRTHSVEKRHPCDDCGKAFKRKESLHTHQLMHTKRRGMGLMCDICNESCRNRADYVTHMQQHIEAGEKMGPDGLSSDSKETKVIDDQEDYEGMEDEEEEEEDHYSDDDDDDYQPPSSYTYQTRRKGLRVKVENNEDLMDQEINKDQVVYVRNKDGNLVKKTIKTLKPVQRRSAELSPEPVKHNKLPTSPQVVQVKKIKEEVLSQRKNRDDDTEVQVQKIVASVFKEHKIPLKNQNEEQQVKESSQFKQTVGPTIIKEEMIDQASTSQSTGKIIKRTIIKRPVVSDEITGPIRDLIQEPTPQALISHQQATTITAPSTSGAKVANLSTKRYIVRRITHHGNTKREVIMYGDGTPVDPEDLAKLPPASVVKRLVLKKPIGKNQNIDDCIRNSLDAKEVLKTIVESENSNTGYSLVPSSKPQICKVEQPQVKIVQQEKQSQKQAQIQQKQPLKQQKQPPPSPLPKQQQQQPSPKQQLPKQEQAETNTESEDNNEITKEKFEQLQKRVELQRRKIEELEARKQQQDYDADDMLPERHVDDDDDEEEEQKLPLKRVYVKSNKKKFNEVREYNDDVPIEKETNNDEETITDSAIDSSQQEQDEEMSNLEQEMETTTADEIKSETVLDPVQSIEDAKIIIIKSQETPSDVDEMSRELCDILDSTDSVVKMQENVLNNLTQITSINEVSSEKTYEEVVQEIASQEEQQKPEVTTSTMEEESLDKQVEQTLELGVKEENESIKIVATQSEEDSVKMDTEDTNQVDTTSAEAELSTFNSQELTETNDMFETSETSMEVEKSQEETSAGESMIELSLSHDTENLNETTESRDSLEDKLSQMEG